jgi:energy-coupling factor transporter ATP-binding protein EcfA2
VKVGLLNYVRLMYQSFRLGGEMIMLASGRTVSVASMALSLMGALFVYVQNVVNAFRHARNLFVACEKICSKVEGACRFSKQARVAMAESGWTETESARWACDSGDLSGDPFLADSLAGTRFKPYDPRFGRALVCFRRSDRARMRAFARQVAIFDAVRCVARSLERTAFATFGGPGVLARGLRHPLVENCVGNDVALGFKSPGVVLTGANASGKSTLMRAVALACVMAQSVTVCFCDAVAVSPVQDIFTHMCIPDDVLDGKSRFQAEMGNVGEIISNAESGRSCILLIDELFSSTTSEQSVVCLDSVLRRLSGYPGCMFILATHHEVEYDGVRRCKMETSKSSLAHSYRMVAGVNDVFNATAGFF